MSNTRDSLGEQATLDGLIAHTLTSLEEDGITNLPSYALYYNTGLTHVIFPNLLSVSSDAFSNCSNLTTVDIGGQCAISGGAFNRCFKMNALILRNTNKICLLGNSQALDGTKIAIGLGGIYVPDTLLSAYKSNSSWYRYTNNIYPLSEYPATSFGTISDSWSTIISNCAIGTIDNYNIGDTKQLTIDGIDFLVEIVAKNTDQLSDNSGNAALTWMVKDFYTTYKMNNSSTNANGWEVSTMRDWLRSSIMTALPAELQTGIKEVKKTYYDKTSSSTKTCNDTIWIPSAYEMFSDSASNQTESNGVSYAKFNSDSRRIKKNINTGSQAYYWLRTAHYDYTNSFAAITHGGSRNGDSADRSNGVVFGFCT